MPDGRQIVTDEIVKYEISYEIVIATSVGIGATRIPGYFSSILPSLAAGKSTLVVFHAAKWLDQR